MLRIFIASCLLAIIQAAPADEKKQSPAWPNVYSYTMTITEPFNTPGGATGEKVGKLWYDGVDGKVKKYFKGHSIYALKDLNGQGAVIDVSKTGECRISHDADVVTSGLTNPLPLLTASGQAEFLGEVTVDGHNMEQWQWKHKGATINIYLRMQDGVAVPLKFDIYPDVPPPGSDMILPTVAVIKDFSTTKPDASVFNVDTSKCVEMQKDASGSHSFKHFL